MHSRRPELPLAILLVGVTMVRRRALGITTAVLVVVAAVQVGLPATAEPATTVSYAANASATRFVGDAFDACDAPTTKTMQAWMAASPFRGVGVYIGGANRTCAQANLTATWVGTVSRMGWRLIPTYVGRQAPCSTRKVKFTPTSASADGTRDASDAVSKAKALGMLAGSAIYNDMENYTATDASCRAAVLRFLSSWTKELHRQGFVSGVYANQASGAVHLADVYGSTSYARPDVLWLARWDRSPALTGWTGIAAAKWANHQRGKQYRGDHDETWGGVTINIDSDRFDAPVATVAYSYRSTAVVNARSGPSTSYPIVSTYPAGSALPVVCQTPGTTIGTSPVWNKLGTGRYVTDYYVDTPSNSGYSSPLPRCTYPYQVTATALNERTGPGSSFPVVRSLTSGSLAWVSCQRSGTTVGTTKIWDRLDSGTYVTDYYLATRSGTTYTAPIPRC
jgi:uncharacterized protein YraI